MWKHIFVSLQFITYYPVSKADTISIYKAHQYDETQQLWKEGQYSKWHISIFSLNKNQANTRELGDSELSVLLNG